jgi:hypothetical protein
MFSWQGSLEATIRERSKPIVGALGIYSGEVDAWIPPAAMISTAIAKAAAATRIQMMMSDGLPTRFPLTQSLACFP